MPHASKIYLPQDTPDADWMGKVIVPIAPNHKWNTVIPRAEEPCGQHGPVRIIYSKTKENSNADD